MPVRTPICPSRLRPSLGGPADLLVIAHRGASGYRPEHTLAAYALAIAQGADHIEPDLVVTRDGVLVARHENEVGGTTDVADHPEFRDRFVTKLVDGAATSGWFTEDFTLAELKTLRAVERIPDVRPGNATHDGAFEVPTLDEVLALAARSTRGDGTPVGVYVETKHPSHFAALGLPMEELVVAALHDHGYRDFAAPAFIQSFEVSNLRQLATMTDLRLVQLVDTVGAPHDLASAGRPETYADLLSPAGLDVVAGYADAVGASKDALIPRRADGTLGRPTPIIEDAHERGLVVHAWTFRAENRFLPVEHRCGPDPDAIGDMAGEVAAYVAAGIDGFFTDHPDRAPAPQVDALVGCSDLSSAGVGQAHVDPDVAPVSSLC